MLPQSLWTVEALEWPLESWLWCQHWSNQRHRLRVFPSTAAGHRRTKECTAWSAKHKRPFTESERYTYLFTISYVSSIFFQFRTNFTLNRLFISPLIRINWWQTGWELIAEYDKPLQTVLHQWSKSLSIVAWCADTIREVFPNFNYLILEYTWSFTTIMCHP